MIRLATPDCIGIEAMDNRLYGGNGRLVSGKAKLALSDGNKIMPLSQANRPEPAISSIYEWQQQRVAESAQAISDLGKESGAATSAELPTPRTVDARARALQPPDTDARGVIPESP